MRKLLLFFCTAMLCQAAPAQTLFNYGKYAVSKSEFVHAFNKNPPSAANRKQALKEYLDLYINYKLKVQAAYDAGLHNDPIQVAELNNFKQQIAENFLNEQARVNDLVREAFTRSQKDLQVAQVFVEFGAGGDTLTAWKTIQQAHNALTAGTDFSQVAATYSTDEATRQTGGQLGFITVFTLPYVFENVAYTTPVGGFSAPFRSAAGYHIFKVLQQRAPIGSRKVAQILISYPPNATEVERAVAQKRADSVYQLLRAGRNFGELARTISNDISSANSDGVLPEFGIGVYHPQFEKVAFTLSKPGEISAPVHTGFGYHILQLLQVVPVSADSSHVETLAALQEKVLKDGRLSQAREKLINRQLAAFGFKMGTLPQQALWKFTDSALLGTGGHAAGIKGATPLFSFSRQVVPVSEWVGFVQGIKAGGGPAAALEYPALMQQFVQLMATDYYRNNLEDYSPEFKKQVKEFKDANLLFGIMDANVWSKAGTDNEGLEAYFNAHKARYTWQPSADALIITAANPAIVTELKSRLERNPADWREIVDSYGNQVSADSSRYELSQLPVRDRTNFTNGLITAPVANQADNSATFNYIIKTYPGGQPRSFEDSKGLVISDYQQVLEDQWIAQLKRKYPVKINMAVFGTIK